MLSADDLGKLRKSGKIVAELRKEAPSFVTGGTRVIEICRAVEERIRKLGGGPAFPCGVGINEVAAHYTSPWNDVSTVPPDSLVKVDFGVEVDGFITDTSQTVTLSPRFHSLNLAAEEALKAALNMIGPNLSFSELGGTIQRTVERYGHRPISNLTGHKIERYTVHAGKSVPNVGGFFPGRFEAGEVYAIEPFVTERDASGKVTDGEEAFIFRLVKERGVRSPGAKALLTYIRQNYGTLPFASRWLAEKLDLPSFLENFREALSAKCVSSYPVLVESSGRPVAQAEHTVLVTKDGCEVLTA